MGGKGSGGKRTPKVDPGVNATALDNALAAYNRPKVDSRDVAAVEKRIAEYLDFCREKDVAPSVAGCSSWLGIGLGTLRNWYEGNVANPELQRAISKFYGVLQDIWAQKMDNGSINPVSGIFIGKSMYGYKDSQEIVIQQTIRADQLSVADLIAESKRLPGADMLELTDGQQTIEASYTIVDAMSTKERAEREQQELENDPRYQNAVERKKRKDDRHAAVVANAPKKESQKKIYMRNYYYTHKEQQRERDRRTAERELAKREALKAQKAAEREQNAQKSAERPDSET